MDIRKIFNNIHPISDEALSLIETSMTFQTVKKGEAVIRQGETTGILLFIIDGIFRIALNSDGKECTLAFGKAGDPFTSVSSLRCDEPSYYSFEAITDAKILTLPITKFREFIDTCTEIAQWFIAFLLKQIHVLERRAALYSGYNAAKKYEVFVYNRPEIMRNVPAKYIAQYLDIAPETLCRIQAAYFKKKKASS